MPPQGSQNAPCGGMDLVDCSDVSITADDKAIQFDVLRRLEEMQERYGSDLDFLVTQFSKLEVQLAPEVELGTCQPGDESQLQLERLKYFIGHVKGTIERMAQARIGTYIYTTSQLDTLEEHIKGRLLPVKERMVAQLATVSENSDLSLPLLTSGEENTDNEEGTTEDEALSDKDLVMTELYPSGSISSSGTDSVSTSLMSMSLSHSGTSSSSFTELGDLYGGDGVCGEDDFLGLTGSVGCENVGLDLDELKEDDHLFFPSAASFAGSPSYSSCLTDGDLSDEVFPTGSDDLEGSAVDARTALRGGGMGTDRVTLQDGMVEVGDMDGDGVSGDCGTNSAIDQEIGELFAPDEFLLSAVLDDEEAEGFEEQKRKEERDMKKREKERLGEGQGEGKQQLSECVKCEADESHVRMPPAPTQQGPGVVAPCPVAASTSGSLNAAEPAIGALVPGVARSHGAQMPGVAAAANVVGPESCLTNAGVESTSVGLVGPKQEEREGMAVAPPSAMMALTTPSTTFAPMGGGKGGEALKVLSSRPACRCGRGPCSFGAAGGALGKRNAEGMVSMAGVASAASALSGSVTAVSSGLVHHNVHTQQHSHSSNVTQLGMPHTAHPHVHAQAFAQVHQQQHFQHLQQRPRKRQRSLTPVLSALRLVAYECSLCKEGYQVQVSSNPWWALFRQECPRCHRTQIPRVDPNHSANSMDYLHMACAEDCDDGDSDGYCSDYCGSDSDDEVEEEPQECSSCGGVYSEGAGTPTVELSHEQASRLLVLMSHARTCPGRHSKAQHAEVCRSTKFLMLHIRDCPGYAPDGSACAHPWCRPCKTLLNHLVCCPQPSTCRICTPLDLPPQLRALRNLNLAADKASPYSSNSHPSPLQGSSSLLAPPLASAFKINPAAPVCGNSDAALPSAPSLATVTVPSVGMLATAVAAPVALVAVTAPVVGKAPFSEPTKTVAAAGGLVKAGGSETETTAGDDVAAAASSGQGGVPCRSAATPSPPSLGAGVAVAMPAC